MLVSVVIPTLDRARLLDRTLGSLLAQAQPPDYEVIVVDNGSTDATRAVVERHRAADPRRLRYVFDDRPGLMIGRSVGAEQARGEILSFIDDDVVIPPGWVRGIAAAFADPGVALATGNNRPFFEVPEPPWLSRLWRRYGRAGRYLYQLSLLELGGAARDIDPVMVWGLNYHIRREVYLQAGGFHPDILPDAHLRFVGDGETGVARSLRAAGHRARFDPRVSLYHAVTAERAVEGYFLRRSRIEGMMIAYGDCRRGAGMVDRRRAAWRRLRWGVLGRAAAAARHPPGSAAGRLLAGMQRELLGGYEEYLRLFASDPLMRQYVREPDYLDVARIVSTYYHGPAPGPGPAGGVLAPQAVPR